MPWVNFCEKSSYNETRERLCDVQLCNPLRLHEVRNEQNCDANGGCNDEHNDCICHNGFDGNGFLCTDIDECSSNLHNCDQNANCFNNIGSFDCNCQSGYEGDGVTCHDIDECSTLSHNCHVDAVCSNSNGSFGCQCITGFTGDGVNCFDIDECRDNTHTCDENADCQNLYGSVACHCKSGYSGDGYTCIDPSISSEGKKKFVQNFMPYEFDCNL